ncbi:MAG: DUF3048 domain-containing protein [Candidatus Doudnabacteria bacterium]
MHIKNFFHQFLILLKTSRKHQIIFGAAGFLLVVVIFLGIFYIRGLAPKARGGEGESELNQKDARQNQNYVLPKGIRLIDGMPVEEEEVNRLPLGVMIENLVTVRPQSGLSQANLVYEALAEGGITRFLAFFTANGDIPEIGPVRSARVYYLDWASELNAAYVYCGGDPYALRLGREYGMKELNQMYNGNFFWRASGALAPHNLFTKIESLREAVRSKGWEEKGSFQPWLFKKEKERDGRGAEVPDIVIPFSTSSYQVVWKYDRENNQYLRYNGGFKHIDKNSGAEIAAKNVVVQYMVAKLKDPGDIKGRLGMHTIGGNKALIFRDGEVIQGIWKKGSRQERTRFYDGEGKEIEFNPGTTWVEVVPPEKTVNY